MARGERNPEEIGVIDAGARVRLRFDRRKKKGRPLTCGPDTSASPGVGFVRQRKRGKEGRGLAVCWAGRAWAARRERGMAWGLRAKTGRERDFASFFPFSFRALFLSRYVLFSPSINVIAQLNDAIKHNIMVYGKL